MMAEGIIKIAVLLCCLARTMQAADSMNINMKSYGITGDCAFKPNPLLESYKKDIEEEKKILEQLKTTKHDDADAVNGIIEKVIKLANTEFGRSPSKYETESTRQFFIGQLFPVFNKMCKRHKCDSWLYNFKADSQTSFYFYHYKDIIANKKYNVRIPSEVFRFEEQIPYLRVHALTLLVASWVSKTKSPENAIKRELINSYRYAKFVRELIEKYQAGRCRNSRSCYKNEEVKEGWFFKVLTSFKIRCYCSQMTNMDICRMDGAVRYDGKKPWTNFKVVEKGCCKDVMSAARVYEKQQLIKKGESFHKLRMAEVDVILGPLLGGYSQIISNGLDLEKASQ